MIGVITDSGTTSMIMTKAGDERKKRSVTIIDETGISISITFWGNLADLPDIEAGRIIACRGVRISDFGGKTLNGGEEHCQVFIDPNSQRRIDLVRWYTKDGETAAYHHEL